MNLKMSNQHDPLFQSLALGHLLLPNRIVMPPMTRSRSTWPGDTANELMAEYYAQRASAGLIISEGTYISPMGKGYAGIPGIYTQEQIAGWRKVTEAVHAKGGRIFAQLWHVGRLSHTSLLGGKAPLSASAIQAVGVQVFVDAASLSASASQAAEAPPSPQALSDSKYLTPGFVQASMPRALSVEEIQEIVQEFRVAAANAIQAGFDGVELHAANGYLVNQFLDSGANQRTDNYGGSLENRLRFLLEVTNSLILGTGDATRVGIRLAPLTTLNGCVDANPEETYSAAAQCLGKLGVVYIHIAEADWDDAPDMPIAFKRKLREVYPGTLIYAGKYTAERARAALSEGWADLIAFGRPFIANPDLPERLRSAAPLNTAARESLFGGGAPGLTDYPTLAQS